MTTPLEATTHAVRVLSQHFLRRPKRRAQPTRLAKKQQRGLKHASVWEWNTNIVGIAVSEKTTARKRLAGQLCLKFYVRRKLARSRVPVAARIPSSLHLDAPGETVITDLEVISGTPGTHAGERVRPLRPGASIGHFRGTEGTIGLIVKRRNSDKPFLLSCSHVLALAGTANAGDAIEQPGDFDSIVGPNQVGRLSQWFTEIRPGDANAVDAALAELDADQEVDPAILDIGVPAGISALSPQELLDMSATSLLRSGAGSGMQSGILEAVRATFPVRVSILGDQVAIFQNVALYRTFCGPGDSGAAVLNARTKEVVGLHFGGVDDHGLFTPIEAVFDAFDLEKF